MTPRYAVPFIISTLVFAALSIGLSLWQLQMLTNGGDILNIRSTEGLNNTATMILSILIYLVTGILFAVLFKVANQRRMIVEEQLMVSLFLSITFVLVSFAQVVGTLLFLGMPPEMLLPFLGGLFQGLVYLIPAGLLMAIIVVSFIIMFALLFIGMKIGSPKGANPQAVPDY